MVPNYVELYPFHGSYLAYVHNFLKKHYWRIRRYMPYEDAIQEAAWKYTLMLRRLQKNRTEHVEKINNLFKRKLPKDIPLFPHKLLDNPDKYLIKNDYKVFFFSKFNPKLNLNGFQYFDLNIEENKKKQIYYLINSEIYFGQISGLFSLANFLDKKLIITDLVIFNHLLISKNFTVIIKKYIKNGIQMKLNEIFNNNYQCIWDQATLKNLNIQTLDNNDQEILEATKEMIEKKNSHQFEVKEYFEKNKIKFKFMNYSILRGIPKFFLEKII